MELKSAMAYNVKGVDHIQGFLCFPVTSLFVVYMLQSCHFPPCHINTHIKSFPTQQVLPLLRRHGYRRTTELSVESWRRERLSLRDIRLR